MAEIGTGDPVAHAAEHGREDGQAAAEAWARFVRSAQAPGEVRPPSADLSGEWADRVSGPALLAHVAPNGGGVGMFAEVCAAYEDAYGAAVAVVVEREEIALGEEE